MDLLIVILDILCAELESGKAQSKSFNTVAACLWLTAYSTKLLVSFFQWARELQKSSVRICQGQEEGADLEQGEGTVKEPGPKVHAPDQLEGAVQEPDTTVHAPGQVQSFPTIYRTLKAGDVRRLTGPGSYHGAGSTVLE